MFADRDPWERGVLGNGAYLNLDEGLPIKDYFVIILLKY